MVSIIIPTYNRAPLIQRAIDSILNQSYKDWELIIVDDGSTDNTEQIVLDYLVDPRVKYYKKANSGATDTRNYGVNKASRGIITFLDSDDEATDLWLAKMIVPFENSENAIVCCGCSYYNENGEKYRTSVPRNLGPAFFNYKGRFTNGGVFAMKREVFLAIGGYNVKLKSSQNTELALRTTPYLRERKLEIVALNEALIKVHIHKGPRIRYNHKGVYEGSKEVFLKYKERFELDDKLYMDWLRTIIYNGILVNQHKDLFPFIKLLLKKARLDYKSWYYLGKWLTTYPKGIKFK